MGSKQTPEFKQEVGPVALTSGLSLTCAPTLYQLAVESFS